MHSIVASVFVLLVFVPAPAGWNETRARGASLLQQEKAAEAIALYEKAVETSPNSGDAHYALAQAHQLAAGDAKPQDASKAPARHRHLEAAAVHYQRAIDLHSAQTPLALRSLVTVFGKDGLNRLPEAEAAARQLVQARPNSLVWHDMLARVVFDQGRDADAVEVLHRARTSVQPADRITLALTLTNTVLERATLSAPLARTLLDDAVPLLDEALKSDPDNRDLLLTKSAVYELLATRVEQDPQRREDFKKESKKIFDRFYDLGRRERGEPEEWTDVLGRTNELNAQGRFNETIEVYQKFLESYPNFAPAYTALGMAYSMAGAPAPPPPPPPPPAPSRGRAQSSTPPPVAAATPVPAKLTPEQVKYLELARDAFQRSVDLTPPADTLPEAYLLLVRTYAADALNQPGEREALLQSAIKKYPTDPKGHYALIRERLDTGNVAGIDSLMNNARAAIASTYQGRLAMAREIHSLVTFNPMVKAPEARKLLADGLAAADEALRLNPASMDALWEKLNILRAQAERETDPQRARSLRGEADRLAERFKAGGGA